MFCKTWGYCTHCIRLTTRKFWKCVKLWTTAIFLVSNNFECREARGGMGRAEYWGTITFILARERVVLRRWKHYWSAVVCRAWSDLVTTRAITRPVKDIEPSFLSTKKNYPTTDQAFKFCLNTTTHDISNKSREVPHFCLGLRYLKLVFLALSVSSKHSQ